MGLIRKLKQLVKRQPRQRGSGMPREYMATTWNDGARKFGVGGDRNKVIRRIKNQDLTDYWPYNKHIIEAFEQVGKKPEWDETGGQSQPQSDLLGRLDPGLIAYDQSRLRRK